VVFQEREAYSFRAWWSRSAIEHYQRAVRESRGRALSSQEAAIEWIECYADTFPFSDANADRPQDKRK
jgi:hypothetical protein